MRDRDRDRDMSSRESDDSPAPPRHPHLSSLIVRPSDSGGGNSDYEPGEVRPDPPPYSRSNRYSDSPSPSPSPTPPPRGRHGMHARSVSPPRHGMRAHSVSPLHDRKGDDRYRPNFNSSNGSHHGSGFVGGRGPGRYRDYLPPNGRGRGGGRFPERDFNGPGFDHGSFRGEGMRNKGNVPAREAFRGESVSRNSVTVAPREGDWICSYPGCGNLNFARRDYCNNCNKPRFGPGSSPRRNYPGPPHLPGPPANRTPPRGINGHRSPPHGWSRDGPRGFISAAPLVRNGGRFPDQVRRERSDYREEEYGERKRFDRLVPSDWGQRDRGRDNFFDGRRGFDERNGRRPLSPPLPPPPPPPPLPRGRWAHDMRERSRSPIRGAHDMRERNRSPIRGAHDMRQRSRSPIRGAHDMRQSRQSPIRGAHNMRLRSRSPITGAHDMRQRSLSPIRGVPPKDHRRDSFGVRGRGSDSFGVRGRGGDFGVRGRGGDSYGGRGRGGNSYGGRGRGGGRWGVAGDRFDVRLY